MVTRDDVANRAGISPAVVSYVVNGGPRRVAPGTRSKVLRAIEDLGYRPNGLARALRVQKTFTIGLIVPDNTNPFFAQLARAVEETAFARGYVLLLGNSGQDDKRQAAYVRTFLERKVDVCSVFVPHATAGLAIMETGSGSEEDLMGALAALLPRDDRYRHRHGSLGHGADHVLPAFVSPSLVVPVHAGHLALGTWQSIVFVDTNADNPHRRALLSFLAG